MLRELAAERERPCLLFSGGKDSIVLLRLAEKAFRPARFPFPLVHVDTGHNFPETLEYRDRRVAALGERLIVASVQASIDRGRVTEDIGPRASRNRLQTTTLLDALAEHDFDAAIGGARRDEERARAKERIFSHRDEFGQWDPKNQRPELWSLYNGRVRRGEHLRVFPLSNWTELDVWEYIRLEAIPLPSIYFAHHREVLERDGMLLRGEPVRAALARRERERRARALPHDRRHDLHRRDPLDGRHARRRDRRGRGCSGHRARRHACRRLLHRGRDGRPQARGLLLSGLDPGSELLRFSTAGSVDDGKSTLIGRLLYDTKTAFEDQLEHVADVSRRRGDERTNLALLTDGLRAEREQGITIDVAYRYFATQRRKFIIADTPGHIQYTRNMVTGASTASLSIILVDARHGLVEQSRRHAFIASLLRIPHLVFAVNKMDLVDWDEATFRRIEAEFRDFASRLDVKDVSFIPVSALTGANVVDRAAEMPWYHGPTLLYQLETVHIASDRNLIDVRFPVQWVIRPQSGRAPRLSRLCRSGRRRRVEARRRGRRAAERPHDDDRVDRAGGDARRGRVRADERHVAPRRRPRRRRAAT